MTQRHPPDLLRALATRTLAALLGIVLIVPPVSVAQQTPAPTQTQMQTQAQMPAA